MCRSLYKVRRSSRFGILEFSLCRPDTHRSSVVTLVRTGECSRMIHGGRPNVRSRIIRDNGFVCSAQAGFSKRTKQHRVCDYAPSAPVWTGIRDVIPTGTHGCTARDLDCSARLRWAMHVRGGCKRSPHSAEPGCINRRMVLHYKRSWHIVLAAVPEQVERPRC